MLDLILGPDGFLIGALGVLALAICLLALSGRHQPQSAVDPQTPMATYRRTLVVLWALAAVCVAGWLLSGRSLSEMGWRPVSSDWGGLSAWAITAAVFAYCLYQIAAAALSARSRASVRRQLEQVDLDLVRPRNREEALAFQALSITAGVTEEVIFRGVLLASISLVAPLWAAVLVSLIAFILLHAYQGLGGLMRVAPTAAGLTAIVLLGGSLWPAILAHIAIDMSAGILFGLVDRTQDEKRTEKADLPDAPPTP